MHRTFPTLFSPLQVGKLTLKNRLISAPMSAHGLSAEGYMTAEAVSQFELLAKGGVAMVIIGETLVHSATGNNHGRVLRLDDPGAIPGIYRCTDAIHRYGALASIELVHPGRRADPLYNAAGKTYGPSAGFCHYGEGQHEVTELTEEMIAAIVEAYGDAAEMAMLAGCDMVTVHGGHGWLINQFLSPANNQRRDRFGGSLENRSRIFLMVADNIRAKCGPSFPIDFRLSGDDLMDGGATLEEVGQLAELLAAKIDLLHISATSFHNRRASIRMFPSMFYPRGVNAYLAEAIKKRVDIPVVTVGGFNDPAHMEELLSQQRVDAIALGRALVADPFLPEKARQGREEDIAYCVRCNNCLSVGFVPYVKYNLGVSHCSVNPWHGLAGEYLNRKLPQGTQQVLVVGGGPAGMQAALGAAECGHRVILCEQSDALGGMLRQAGHPPFKQDIKRYVQTLTRRIENNPLIEVRYRTKVTPEMADRLAPDTLIVAIGAEPLTLDLPGGGDARLTQAVRLHQEGVTIGETVVIIGAGQVGVEEGIALAREGKQVTIVERLGRIACDAAYIHYLALINELEQLPNLQVELNTTCVSVNEAGVVCRRQDGGETIYPADTIVSAVGLTPRRAEAERFYQVVDHVLFVGDCRHSAQMAEAVLSGYFAGYNLQRL